MPREIIRNQDGHWLCDDLPVSVELRTLGLDPVLLTDQPIELAVVSDDQESLVVTIQDGTIIKAAIKGEEEETTIGGFVLYGRSYADKYFLTGTMEEQALAREKLLLDHFGEEAEIPGFMPDPEPTVHHSIVDTSAEHEPD